jgi:hypothetical protein
MAARARGSRITGKQLAADRGNLVKARKALKGRPRTEKQLAASRKNLAKARLATHVRSQGKTYKAAKKPKAPDTWTLPGEPSLHDLPVCGAVAAAVHLAEFTGAYVPDDCVLELAELVRDATMADLLEYLKADGFPGTGEKLAHFERCDPGTEAPGLIYGVQLPQGYHAVLARPGGALSWGRLVPWCALLPWLGTPEEAWWLEWEAELCPAITAATGSTRS